MFSGSGLLEVFCCYYLQIVNKTVNHWVMLKGSFPGRKVINKEDILSNEYVKLFC
uniref:Uncharacterized protein n=1 Tax=Schistosoma mansoni TaxID=6183 RepID=A0A5K4F4I1_SCHMA